MINRHTYIDRLHSLRVFEGETRSKLRKAESADYYALSEQQRSNLVTTLRQIEADLKGYETLEPEQLVALYARLKPLMGLSVSQLASMATKFPR